MKSFALYPLVMACVLSAGCAVTHAQAESKSPPAEVAMCGACHGTHGISQTPDAPHLAGQSAIYLKAQLKAYRSGKRQHEVMAVMAKPLTDEQIDVAAQWYSSLKIKLAE